jgi:hypothetical protein
MTSIDTNVDNYTASELMAILGIGYPNEDDIIDETQKYIDKYEKEGNDEFISFFENIRDKLIQYSRDQVDGGYSYEPSKKQSDNWYENEALSQPDKTQKDKITERKQKIDVYDNQHVPMDREQLGVNNNFLVDVAQDTLNPNLKNTTERLINLDSQYRQVNSINGMSTDYVLDLTESIIDVLSLRLYSIQIPYAWYTVDITYSNTCFWVCFTDENGIIIKSVMISVEPGNYTTEDATSNRSICYAVNNAFVAAGFTITSGSVGPVNINPTNGKITINLSGYIYTDPDTSYIYNIDQTTILVFFDPTAALKCKEKCVSPIAVNQTLGWLLGFRIPQINVDLNGNIATAIADFYGPRYLILVIDDFNQNHINNGLIGITEYSNTLKLPSYYSPDMKFTCTPANPNGNNLQTNSNLLAGDPDAGPLIMEKWNATYKPGVTVMPSAPRTLTQSQIYTINEIMKNNEKTSEYRLKSPTTTDTFAILPIKRSANARIGELYVEFGGSLQDNKRTYFGPVNLERLHVKLLDDKGNLLNLNGADWSITLISENLYQY